MKRVLILDDDERLLKLVADYLRRMGYSVLTFNSSVSALQQFPGLDVETNLVIADLTMPISSGVEVAVQFKTYRPALKVILMSGYPVVAWDAHDTSLLAELPSDSVQILIKPFSPPTLLAMVNELIGPGECIAEITGKPHVQTADCLWIP